MTRELKLLKEKQKSKPAHGIYYRQCLSDKWDTVGSFKWLVDGRLQGQTEALIIAAQDGVIMTRDYQQRILGKKGPTSCRCCRQETEKLGHLLSKCEPLFWTLYKERHDRVVYQILLALTRKYEMTLPSGLQWGV